MIDREEPLTPEPPPVPANHPGGRHRIQESVRISVLFYVEIAIALCGLLVLFQLVGVGGYVLLAAAALGFLGFSLRRMVRRVIDLRKKGRAPWEATAAFWIVLLVPIAVGAWYVRRVRVEVEPASLRAREAGMVLTAALEAERAFHREFARYTYNVKELGIVPGASGRYVLGFPAACTTKFAVEGARFSWELADFGWSRERQIAVKDFFRTVKLAENCADPKGGFEAYAVGSLRAEDPLDVWRMDETGKISHLR